MNPDYKRAARKAVETIIKYGQNPEYTDPLTVLEKLPNVRLLSYGITNDASPLCEGIGAIPDGNQEAFTLFERKEGKLQFIVIYNQNVSPVRLRFVLARELGNIVLEHDGSNPEEIWLEEATCFAYHFLCPLPLLQEDRIPINYRPKCSTYLWELKSTLVFDSVENMKSYISEERNKINRYIGKTQPQFEPDDVELKKSLAYDKITGWKNCFDVVLDGKTVGYCGE